MHFGILARRLSRISKLHKILDPRLDPSLRQTESFDSQDSPRTRDKPGRECSSSRQQLFPIYMPLERLLGLVEALDTALLKGLFLVDVSSPAGQLASR